MKTFVKFVHNFLTFVKKAASGASRIDLVFDSYIERTIKDLVRQKRANTPAIELNKIERTKPPPKANGHILAISEKQSTP